MDRWQDLYDETRMKVDQRMAKTEGRFEMEIESRNYPVREGAVELAHRTRGKAIRVVGAIRTIIERLERLRTIKNDKGDRSD